MATKANINIDQGTTFSTTISLTDSSGNQIDLTNYTAKAQLRVSYSSINSISFSTLLSNGQINLALDANTTTLLTRARYVFDVVITDSANVVTRVVEGVAYVDPAITRSVYSNTYYTLQLANVQQIFYPGDTVYQSNGSANVTAIVYESDNAMLTPVYVPLGATPGYGTNIATIKVMNPTGNLSLTATSGYKIYSSNTNANGSVTSITQTTTKNQE
jgi:hypothetical protein